MTLGRHSLRRFLTQAKVPLWLVLIMALVSWVIPLSLGEYFESRESEEARRRVLVSQLVAYARDVELFAQAVTQFRQDLEVWDVALSEGASLEFVTFLGERACESEETMLARSQAMHLQELSLGAIASELEGEGYDFAFVFRERGPALKRSDISSIVMVYQTIPPSQFTEYTEYIRPMLSPIIKAIQGVEDATNRLSEALFDTIIVK